MSEHLYFTDCTPEWFVKTHKTKIYRIQSKHDGSILGEVRWHAPWRQYCYMTSPGRVWSHDCLHDLSEFIKELMNARKVK